MSGTEILDHIDHLDGILSFSSSSLPPTPTLEAGQDPTEDDDQAAAAIDPQESEENLIFTILLSFT